MWLKGSVDDWFSTNSFSTSSTAKFTIHLFKNSESGVIVEAQVSEKTGAIALFWLICSANHCREVAAAAESDHR
jgi:hypothetical protein